MRARLLGVLLLVIGTAVILSADIRSAQAAFEAARKKDVVEGDLKGAIPLYQQAIEQAEGRGAIAAKSLLALGAAYQRTGAGDARAVYARIVREFPGEKDVVQTARERMARLPVAASSRAGARQDGDFAARRLMTINGGGGTITPDGRLLAETVGNDLVVWDLVSHQSRRLVQGGRLASASSPAAFSPDRRQVAYQWSERDASGQFLTASLRVVGLGEGATPRNVVTGDPSLWSLQPVGWSPDGNMILAAMTKRGGIGTSTVAWIAVSDGSMKPIAAVSTGGNVVLQEPSLSPDGRYLSYRRFISPGSPDNHIYVLDLSNGTEIEVVGMAGRNTSPVWTPDSSHLVFQSNRTGTLGLWSVGINGGKASGEPVSLRAGFQDRPIQFSQDGVLYCVHTSGDRSPSVFVADRDSAGARVVQTFPGVSAMWSPANNAVAFAQSSPTNDLILVIRSLDSAAERTLRRAGGIGNPAPKWFHDGSRVLIFNNAEASYFVANLNDGSFGQALPRDAQGHSRSGVAAISADDAHIYTSIGPPNGNYTGVVEVNLATGEERPILTFPGGALPASGAPGIVLSPDGNTLALMTPDGQGRARISTVRTDGSNYAQVYGPFPAARIPDLICWTPDGRELIFVESDDPKNWRVMRIPATGGAAQAEGLSSSPLGNSTRPSLESVGSLDISPDGRRLVFAGPTQVRLDLMAVDNILSIVDGPR